MELRSLGFGEVVVVQITESKGGADREILQCKSEEAVLYAW
jgi:hypothetical protein